MHIALLIDCENASPESIHGILGELAGKGTINIRRAYGNWKAQSGWEAKLHPFAIQPVQQFAYTKGKNAVDMTMAIDAMDLLYSERVDGFALVTSDSDFTPLVHRLLAKGKLVFGFGESKSPEAFRKACSSFIHTDDFREPSTENPTPTQRRNRGQLRGDCELMNCLRAAIDSVADDTGWAYMAKIGHHIANDAKLASRNYGYAKWSDLIRATEYFEESVREGHHVYFRRRNGQKAAEATAA